MLDKMEDGKWIAQRKFNGDRCLIHYSGNGDVELYNRHGSRQKYKLPGFLRQELLNLNIEPAQEYWLDGELLHPKIPNTIVLYDVLHAGDYLYGCSLTSRLTRLQEICRHPSQYPDPPIALLCSPHVWMAESFDANFKSHFKDYIDLPIIEGLVLKLGSSLLSHWGYKPYEVDWQVRCRKPGPNYSH